MQRFEYHVVPAPRRGEKARGLKTTEDRFALALTQLMNQLGAEGWDYVRADALPCDERSGLTGTKTSYQNMLVFRRVIETPPPVEVAVTAPITASRAPVVPEPAAPALPPLKLGAAVAPAGPSPAIGPAKPELAAE